MSMNKLVVLAVIMIITGFKHPMHVTVTEIEFDKNAKAIEMSMHVFRDDLETEIRQLLNEGDMEILELNESKRDEVLGKYLKQQVKIKVNGKDIEISYLGHQVEGEAIWAFMEVPNIKKLKTLEIENNTLLDLYKDQANLVHFEYSGEVYSQKIDNGMKSAHYNIEDL